MIGYEVTNENQDLIESNHSEYIKRNKRIYGFSRFEFGLYIVLFTALFILKNSIMLAHIPTSSMEPTIKSGSKVLVSMVEKNYKGIKFGDLVVFKAPDNYIDNDEYYVKRVIGLPGDTLLFVEGKVIRNGVMLNEPYIMKGSRTEAFYDIHKGEFTVPEGQLFLLGDNRENSGDSRFMGYIDFELIEGKVIKIFNKK